MEESLDLWDVLAMLERRLRLIVAVFAVGILGAILFLLLVTPEYSADATLKFNPSRFEINNQRSSISSELFDRLISGEIAAIQSPEVIKAVIESEGLLLDPELNRQGILEFVGSLVSGLLGKDLFAADRQLKIQERFEDRLYIHHPDRTNLITITYSSENAEKSARVANAVAGTFLAQHLESRHAAPPLAAKWLNERKEDLRKSWQESEDAAEKYKTEHNLSYVSGDALREQHVNRLNEQLVLAGTKTEEARARTRQVKELLKSRNYQQLANVAQSDVLTRLRDRLAAASQREASLNSALLPGHPQHMEVRAEIASLRMHIENEGKRVLDKLEVEFRSAKEREALIRANFDKTIQAIQASGLNLVKLRELERTAESDRAIFEAFLNRSNETLEQSTGNIANFTFIRQAQIPLQPTFPSKAKVLLLSMFASLAAGLGLALVLETYRNTFRSRAHVRDILGLNTLAVLPRASSAPRPSFNGGDTSRAGAVISPGSALMQAIAALKRKLDLIVEDEHIKMLAVTSPGQGEGKSTIAAGLAREIASSGRKALLIETSARKAGLGRTISKNGATEDGARQSDQSPVIRDPATGLDTLPAMGGSGASSGFVRSAEFSDLLRAARENYDLVIVDAGTLESDSDSLFLAIEADAALFVIQWDKTRREKALVALEALRSWNVRICGAVLNAADLSLLARENDRAPMVSDQDLRPAHANGASSVPARAFSQTVTANGRVDAVPE